MVGRRLYGYGIPVNGVARDRYGSSSGAQERVPFENALDYEGTYLLTYRERRMIGFMSDITDKPDWANKIKNEAIVYIWRLERAQQEKITVPEKALSERMFEYCLEELRDYADQEEEMGFIPALAANATVFKSDSLITEDLNECLRAAAAPLEDVPDTNKDWHPGSDEKVLDLVHPSLFPLLYGRTKILAKGTVPLEHCVKSTDTGEIVPVPQKDHLTTNDYSGMSSWPDMREPQFYSARFQWLPCQVDFTEDETVRISSYINNLHPDHHKALYEAIERVIAKVIPMWDATLSSLDWRQQSARIDVDGHSWIDPEGQRSPVEGESDDDKWKLDEEWRLKNRVLILPEPDKYSEPATDEESTDDAIDLREDFADQGLQVIVKLANIHLTPDRPRYDGGSWHIEGQMNEHICASAIYYYDSDNVTESLLSFRESTGRHSLEDKPYEQDDFEHFERLYGIKNNGPTTQVLGHVRTKKGRLIAFPNVLQHRVSSFELEKKARPGHRKILALFLVDPNTPIPSTAHVPPQRRDWWREEVLQNKRVAALSKEFRKTVTNADKYTIDLEEAKSLRLELMEERKAYVQDIDERFEQKTFAFCEH